MSEQLYSADPKQRADFSKFPAYTTANAFARLVANSAWVSWYRTL